MEGDPQGALLQDSPSLQNLSVHPGPTGSMAESLETGPAASSSAILNSRIPKLREPLSEGALTRLPTQTFPPVLLPL